MKKILTGLVGMAALLVTMPMIAAFEAHVLNVTATIENALFVHPESLVYGTVFPQEYFETSFFITFSSSFSATNQTRDRGVDYVIKQKPECITPQGTHPQVGEDANGNFVCPQGSVMMPLLCPYLSKKPDNLPSTGLNALNDTGVPAFHDPFATSSYAHGKLVKFNANGSTIGNDPSDTWTIDLAVPCFGGQCAQDWADFVHSHNPAADPDDYMANPADEHQLFGCDLWVEVTQIF